jgi:hypothetical protein
MRPFRRIDGLEGIVGFINVGLFFVNKGFPTGIMFFAQHQEAIVGHVGFKADCPVTIFYDFHLGKLRTESLLGGTLCQKINW